MLANARAHATLPTSDLEAARPFYEMVLGLTPAAVLPLTVWYRAGSFTQIGFAVDDINLLGLIQLNDSI